MTWPKAEVRGVRQAAYRVRPFLTYIGPRPGKKFTPSLSVLTVPNTFESVNTVRLARSGHLENFGLFILAKPDNERHGPSESTAMALRRGMAPVRSTAVGRFVMREPARARPLPAVSRVHSAI